MGFQAFFQGGFELQGVALLAMEASLQIATAILGLLQSGGFLAKALLQEGAFPLQLGHPLLARFEFGLQGFVVEGGAAEAVIGSVQFAEQLGNLGRHHSSVHPHTTLGLMAINLRLQGRLGTF